MNYFIDYEDQKIEVEMHQIKVLESQENDMELCNIRVKNFRSLVSKKQNQEDFYAFRFLNISSKKSKQETNTTDGHRRKLE